jgi:membrane-bound lytic murein transglycosylase D
VPVTDVTPRDAASQARRHLNGEVARWENALNADLGTREALTRLAVYRPLIGEALASRSIPPEFIYLPLIESQFLPGATSPAGAAGIWQLMPATARAYGLEVSTWVDERRDPVHSTFAAVRHLHDLYVELGSWQLAAAAYNCGSRRVAAAARGSRSDAAYWRGRAELPAETRAYLPKLLAAIQIGRRTRSTSPGGGQPLRFAEVLVAGGTTLTSVATRFGVSPDTVFALNPHLVRRSTPPGRPWPVRLPPLPR